MATKNYSVIESDISGDEGATTITFGYKDLWYEVDLTSEEDKVLSKALAPYIKAGRKRPEPKPVRNLNVPETSFAEREQIRSWAKAKGHDVAPRGRIPMWIYREYQDAHPKKKGE